VTHHGISFTVSRLKDLKQQRIHFENESTNTFVSSHSDLSPRGSFRYLWRKSVSFKDALHMLNVYTCAVSEHITHNQAKKFVDSVLYEGPEIDLVLSIKGLTGTFRDSFKYDTSDYGSILKWLRKENKRAPHLVNGQLKTVLETSIPLNEIVSSFRDTSESNRRLLIDYKDLFSKAFYGKLRNEYVDEVFSRGNKGLPGNLYQELQKPPLVGKIGNIQEKGLKLRSVANPFRILQHTLFPLGTFLYGSLKRLNTDCTYDQQKGHDFIKSELTKGRTMYAYDLSNATDRFPLKIQVKLIEDILNSLRRVGPGPLSTLGLPPQTEEGKLDIDELKQQLKLLQEVSRGRWYAPDLAFYSKSQYLQWRTGQPLGLFPSFAMFALAHNILLKNISDEHNAGDCFRVLGDDVIISDERVALSYKKVLDKLGCKISEDKSIISDKFGEFAGMITTKDSSLVVPKWQNFSLNNPLGPVATLGVKGFKFIPQRHRKTVRFLSSLPKPYGLEINPDGLSLDSRVVPFHEILKEKNHTLEPVTDYKQAYTDKESSVQAFWNHTITSFDGMVKRFSKNSKFKEKLVPIVDASPQLKFRNDVLKIEHFNTHINSLSNWDYPTVNRPSAIITVDRDSWSKPNFSLYKLKSMFPKPKKGDHIDPS
jgi:hypothetical protein